MKVLLRNFEDILKENERTSWDASLIAVSKWNIYHPTAGKCLTVYRDCVKYFGNVVTVRPDVVLNETMENRSVPRKMYIVTDAGTHDENGRVRKFSVYDHWFTEIKYLEDDLFEI